MCPVLAFSLFALVGLAIPFTQAYPPAAHESLAGLSKEQRDVILTGLHVAPPEKPPGPLNNTSAKLVNDPDHPWIPPRPDDIRGPCPGLNVLASHGYLPRNGIATPGQIVTASMEGFNMNNGVAKLITYIGFLVDGNLVTNLMSIGQKSPKTGPDPPKPAIVGGLNTHAVLEGDTSMSRADAFFGDNHSFNQTLWDQFVDFSNRFGGGKYNLTVAIELRKQLIQQSTATNPTFSFVSPRYFTAFAESAFPISFFIDGRQHDGQLDLNDALDFFRDGKFPDGFFRVGKPMGVDGVDTLVEAIPIPPGANNGTVNSYTPDPNSGDFTSLCKFYVDFVNQTVISLYPSPSGVLKDALNRNLNYFYEAFNEVFNPPSCPQIFPFRQ